MRSVGVRELRQAASQHIRAVEKGETIQVTERGKPVAMLVPVPRLAGWAGLEASGRLTPGKRDLLKHRPLPAKKGTRLPTEVLMGMRMREAADALGISVVAPE